jgi:GNAT superfamily N-acetyltransferase
MTDNDIEALERATVDAVAPDALLHRPGWLLPMDGGTIGRAHSAVPLSHPMTPNAQAQQAADVAIIVATYQGQGRVPVFRLPDTATHLHRALEPLGFQRVEPSLVMVGRMTELGQIPLPPQGLPQGLRVEVLPHATPGWQGVFLGPGFDPVDGANRVRNLARASGTLFVSAWVGGETVACGTASLGHGWLGVHGMRTAQIHRGQGLAAAILRVMATEAAQRGTHRVFLQVGAANAPALALYAKAGLHNAWPYAYWKPLG